MLFTMCRISKRQQRPGQRRLAACKKHYLSSLLVMSFPANMTYDHNRAMLRFVLNPEQAIVVLCNIEREFSLEVWHGISPNVRGFETLLKGKSHRSGTSSFERSSGCGVYSLPRSETGGSQSVEFSFALVAMISGGSNAGVRTNTSLK